jgi:hypothetical protein
MPEKIPKRLQNLHFDLKPNLGSLARKVIKGVRKFTHKPHDVGIVR